jgi:hypothetical protein
MKEQITMGSTINTTCVSFAALTANGESGVVTTTELTLTFNPGCPGLTEANFGIGGAKVVSVTETSGGDGGTYAMKISDIAPQNGEEIQVSVAVIPKGYSIEPTSRTVQIWVRTVNWSITSSNGESNLTTTDTLQLKFVPALEGLTANDFKSDSATILKVTELPLTKSANPDETAYEMKIKLNDNIKNGNEILIDFDKKIEDLCVSPAFFAAKVYVHMPRRIWVQGLVSGANLNLDTVAPAAISFNEPFEDDSKLAKLANGGIKILQAGDYELSITMNVTADKSGMVYFRLGGGYKNNEVCSFSVSAEAGIPVTVTKSLILPDCTEDTILSVSAVSQYKQTGVKISDAAMFVKAIPMIPLPSPEPKRANNIKGVNKLKSNYKVIGKFSLENKGGFDVKIKVQATWVDENGEEVTGKGWVVDKYYTNPNTRSGKISNAKVKIHGDKVAIPDGATVQIIADIAVGPDATGDEKYTYKSDSEVTAYYKITGTTICNTLECEYVQ